MFTDISINIDESGCTPLFSFCFYAPKVKIDVDALGVRNKATLFYIGRLISESLYEDDLIET